MSTTPEELALDLSRASLQSQEQSENQLREKATKRVGHAISLLTIEVLALVVSLVVTLVS
jgi:hypothetical protein